MKPGARVHVSVSMAETKISKRFDPIPSGTLCPNADEIKYLQRLVIYKARFLFNTTFIFILQFCLCILFTSICISYCSIEFQYIVFIAHCIQMYFFQDSAIIMLNKPPKLPVKVWMSFFTFIEIQCVGVCYGILISCWQSC